jgi:hypothetical protein
LHSGLEYITRDPHEHTPIHRQTHTHMHIHIYIYTHTLKDWRNNSLSYSSFIKGARQKVWIMPITKEWDFTGRGDIGIATQWTLKLCNVSACTYVHIYINTEKTEDMLSKCFYFLFYILVLSNIKVIAFFLQYLW